MNTHPLEITGPGDGDIAEQMMGKNESKANWPPTHD